MSDAEEAADAASHKAAIAAARQHTRPIVVVRGEEVRFAPYLGVYVPTGWVPLRWADIEDAAIEARRGEDDDGGGAVLLVVDSTSEGRPLDVLAFAQAARLVESIGAAAKDRGMKVGWGIRRAVGSRLHLAAYRKP